MVRVSEIMIKEQNIKNINVINKEVPKYEWELQRFELKEMGWDLDKNLSEGFESKWGVDYYYTTEHNGVKGEIKIQCYNRNEKGELMIDYIEMNFSDDIYGEKNWKSIEKTKQINSDGSPFDYKKGGVYKMKDTTEEEQWNQVRDYFDKYLIHKDERIKMKVDTPRMKTIKYHLNQLYHYEYNKVMLDTIFGDREYSEKSSYEGIWERFEDDYSKMEGSDKNGYFRTPISMIKSWLDDGKCSGEMDYWLEGLREEIQEDIKEEVV